MFSSGMLDGFAKSFFKYLQSDEQMHAGVMRAIDFVSQIDARLARIEAKLDALAVPRITGAGGTFHPVRTNGADDHA